MSWRQNDDMWNRFETAPERYRRQTSSSCHIANRLHRRRLAKNHFLIFGEVQDKGIMFREHCEFVMSLAQLDLDSWQIVELSFSSNMVGRWADFARLSALSVLPQVLFWFYSRRYRSNAALSSIQTKRDTTVTKDVLTVSSWSGMGAVSVNRLTGKFSVNRLVN